MIARVVPDVPAVDKEFDYLVPDDLRDQVRVGTVVRIDLHGRRVRGWVVDLPATADVDDLKPIAKVTGAGPPPGVLDLARWAAWRWAGRPVHLLRVATPPRVAGNAGGGPVEPGPGSSVRVVRVAPSADRLPHVLQAVEESAGRALVVVPEVAAAARLARRLRQDGRRVALLAGDVDVRDWTLAASGDAVVVGTRIAVWAPTPDGWLRRVVVLDEHDEALQSEQAPTWHARDVAVERARRDGAEVTLVSPVPSLHARALAGSVEVEPGVWPIVEVADRRDEDPRTSGPFSPAFERSLRQAGDRRVVCMLNRLGRSRLLACTSCGEVATCEVCDGHVVQPEDGAFACPACGSARPAVCLRCGGGRFRNLRRGVTRIREELEALAREPVGEVTGAGGELPDARVVVGTEAVLHRLAPGSAGVVAFLDLDQELLAPRYRSAEQALALLARAARALGPKSAGGRLLLQTRMPEHPVVAAARRSDVDVLAGYDLERRRLLGHPPAAAVAQVSGAGAEAWAAAAHERVTLGVEVLGPADGSYLVRAPDWAELADFLAAVPRPPGRLRVAVDPPRL